MTFERYSFAVVDDVFSVVEADLGERNRRFLESVDDGYFAWVGRTQQPLLTGSDAQRAAIAIRTAYHHGIETLFTVLGAFLQAPEAVLAWVPRSWPSHLRELAERLRVGRTILTARGSRQLLYEDVAREVHSGAWSESSNRDATIQGFARVWSRLGAELRDPLNQDEYNSIKHGFRVRAGGFSLRVGAQPQLGTPAPPEAMRTVGSSVYGTTFFAPEGRDGSRASRDAVAFRVRRYSLNWSVDRMLLTLPLISASIHNVRMQLLLREGSERAGEFTRPADGEFDAPLRHGVVVTSSNMDVSVPWQSIDAVSKETVRAELHARTSSEGSSTEQ